MPLVSLIRFRLTIRYGKRLGGCKNKGLAHLPPVEAARIAAERRLNERRKQDSLHCLPSSEIIEILDGSSSDEEERDSSSIIKQKTRKKDKTKHMTPIDLDSLGSSEDRKIGTEKKSNSFFVGGRKQDSLLCLPCSEVIEIVDESSCNNTKKGTDSSSSINYKAQTKNKIKYAAPFKIEPSGIIDLT